MAGYSGTPLVQKLGIKPGFSIAAVGAPKDYRALVPGLPEDLALRTERASGLDLIHLFVTARSELARRLPTLKDRIKPDGTIWVSWPKKASKVATDMTEDAVRAVALPLGLVDVKVCAVDDVWSGLKLVWRKEHRGAE
jgi:hypothetical protein